MHVVNPLMQNNLIFLFPFSKKGEAQEVLSSIQKNLTFSISCCRAYWEHCEICCLHSFWHMCYPWLLKWYASIAILCCYHNPKVYGDKLYCICFSCVALGRYLLQCLIGKLGWPH